MYQDIKSSIFTNHFRRLVNKLERISASAQFAVSYWPNCALHASAYCKIMYKQTGHFTYTIYFYLLQKFLKASLFGA